MLLSAKPKLLFAAVLAVWMTGCSRDDLAELPIHELDLNGQGPTPREWRYIVIHHSATARGNAAVFDRLHRSPPFGFDELGYHFVITNGDGGRDGAVEVGPRWRKQKWGAHCGGTPGNEYNNHGIGICLVGDFTKQMPTDAQIASLQKLVERLMSDRHVPPENVIAHSDAPNASTECPGRAFHAYLLGTFRALIGRRLAEARRGSDLP
ncbi:MAG: peptidoglycan recognition protein family protein [Planctomycetota bacterium]|jgi:N-acetyl-anhydromuramyl-L-alanine amidase AmpD